jgi:hypothetical protein
MLHTEIITEPCTKDITCQYNLKFQSHNYIYRLHFKYRLFEHPHISNLDCNFYHTKASFNNKNEIDSFCLSKINFPCQYQHSCLPFIPVIGIRITQLEVDVYFSKNIT